jgi:dTMP kinase
MIIAIEGMDGAGKTTICKYIEEKYGFVNVEKPTKYMFEKNGKIDYDAFNKELQKIYKSDNKIRSTFFGAGNLLAVTKFRGRNIVLDRHFASNYFWNGDICLDKYFEELIRVCGKPDITIFLHATPQTRYKRLLKRDRNDLDLHDDSILLDGTIENVDFLEKFALNYAVVETEDRTIGEVCESIDQIVLSIMLKEQGRDKKYGCRL